MNDAGLLFFKEQTERLVRVVLKAILGNDFKVSIKNPFVQVRVINLDEMLDELRRLNEKEVVIPEFPKIPEPLTEIRIKNFPLSFKVNNLGQVQDLLKAINEKLDNPAVPTIQLPEQLKEVGITNLEQLAELLRSNKPQDYIPVRLSDGDRFYAALENVTSAASSSSFSDSAGTRQKALVSADRRVQVDVNGLGGYETNDVDEASATLTYVGMEDKDGTWLIKSIDTTSGTAIRFATQLNNTEDNYTDAWTGRAALDYGLFSEAF